MRQNPRDFRHTGLRIIPRMTSRQICAAHQIAVAFARRAATFVEGPDDEALAATAITAGNNFRVVRRKGDVDLLSEC
jgi:hypothetical protein